ncbi:MAG: hypothetical protein IIY21_04375 [Clostridiales bacterium]|nr:hypothetical protein [Clostridiales bacterium]MBQ1573878.1 hypothetical protein [Clostridiales bacterium]
MKVYEVRSWGSWSSYIYYHLDKAVAKLKELIENSQDSVNCEGDYTITVLQDIVIDPNFDEDLQRIVSAESNL